MSLKINMKQKQTEKGYKKDKLIRHYLWLLNFNPFKQNFKITFSLSSLSKNNNIRCKKDLIFNKFISKKVRLLKKSDRLSKVLYLTSQRRLSFNL